MSLPSTKKLSGRRGGAAQLKISSRLVESVKGKVWEIRLIVEGWSKNQRYYSAEVLRKAKPLFEGCPLAIYGFDSGTVKEHVPPEFRDSGRGLIANVVGWAKRVRESVEDGRLCLVADFHCVSEHVRSLLLQASELEMEIPFGLSIDALGDTQPGTAEGRTGMIVTRIDHVFESTIVDHPAAGGAFVRLVASFQPLAQAQLHQQPSSGKQSQRGSRFMRDVEFMRYLTGGDRPGAAGSTARRIGESQQPSAQTIPSWDGGSAPRAAGQAVNQNSLRALLELALEFVDQGNIDAATAVLAKFSPQPAGYEDTSGPVYEAEGDDDPFISAVKKLRGLFDQASEILADEHEELEPLRPGLEELSKLVDETAEELGISFDEGPGDKPVKPADPKMKPPAMKEGFRR